MYCLHKFQIDLPFTLLYLAVESGMLQARCIKCKKLCGMAEIWKAMERMK